MIERETLRVEFSPRYRNLLLMLLLGLCAPTVARASEGVKTGSQADESPAQVAKEHARKGNVFYNLGKFQQSVIEFEAAYQVLPVPALLFNIAQCYRQLNDLPMAARLYRSFLRSNPSLATAKQAQDLLDKVDAEISHSKASVASSPLQLSLPAGASAAGPEAGSPVSAGGRPASTAAPIASIRVAPPAAVVKHRRWPAVVLGSVGLATLAGGLLEGLASSSASSQLSTLHHQTAIVDPAQDRALRSDASSKRIRARNLYIASAAAFSIGAVLFFAF